MATVTYFSQLQDTTPFKALDDYLVTNGSSITNSQFEYTYAYIGADSRFYTFKLLGNNFTYDADNKPTGGTITGLKVIVAGLPDAVLVEARDLQASLVDFSITLADNKRSAFDVLFAGNDKTTGSNVSDTLHSYGGEADTDTLEGGSGNDSLLGREGRDWLFGGNDDDYVAGGTGDDILVGGDGNDRLYGQDNGDTLRGERGDDDIDGGEGWDWAFYDQAAAGIVVDLSRGIVEMDGDGGRDTINNIEGVIGSAFGDTIIGDSGDNRIEGIGGNDTLNGGAGADVLDGGNGFDLVSFADASSGVTASMSAGQRGDAAGDSYTSIEGLIGSAHADSFTGNGSARLQGGAGDDTYYVSGADQVVELSGGGTDTVVASRSWTLQANVENLTLTAASLGRGNELANALTGSGGNDTLDGGAGADRMAGGAGNDVYYADALDTVVETAGGGIDIVHTSASSINLLTLAHVEHVIATSLGSVIMNGDGAANTLTGGSADDVLNGGAGADVMNGGLGNDVYYVDNAADVVSELAGQGLDSVFTSVSFALGAEVETLTATGSANISLTGSAYANTLTGNTGRNTLKGGSGNDKLWGGLGQDTLWGQSGRDTFMFDDRHTSSSKTRADYLADFSGRGGDKIDLRAVDANSKRGGDQNFSFIGTKAFTKAGQVRYEKAGKDTYVYLNTDSDRSAEAVLKIKGAMDLQKGWFVL